MAEPRRRLAREEGREALEPLRPGPEGAGRRIRPVGDVRQGRRRHAGGVERGHGLQLGQGRRGAEADGGQEPDEADEGLGDQGLRRVQGGSRGARQLELENNILRGVARVLKAGSSDSLTNREKALVINELRATTGRSLRELTDS